LLIDRAVSTLSLEPPDSAMARIYGGVHYRFDQQVGQSVAEFVVANRMRPRAR
jgi:hypothetical protein